MDTAHGKSFVSIRGDQARTGYCFRGRKVFCVYYNDTATRC